MIPLKLTISGFLSYAEPVELDFRSFDLACISGANGAGKSSLLDAITWSLFGQARKRDESVINLNPSVKAAEVALTFQYENNVYRVQRALPRGKANQLEFHILVQGSADDLEAARWKPLTERTLRETQARIEQTLRLDYDTFVNASFFLQGKADQFTQQRPGDRKRILGSILGLEAWETYRERASEQRKGIEEQIRLLDGRLREVNGELAEEPERRSRLQVLEADLARLTLVRQAQENNLEQVRRLAATLNEQRRLVETLRRQVESASNRLAELDARRDVLLTDRQALAGLQERAGTVRQAYADWQAARLALVEWEARAAEVREIEKRRQPLLDEINTCRASLVQEQRTLLEQQAALEAQLTGLPVLQAEHAQAQSQAQQAEAQLNQRLEIESVLRGAQQQLAEARLENQRLRLEMDEIKGRIDKLSGTEGAVCPLCGQPLSPDDRTRLVASLAADGKDKGDRFRLNKTIMEQLEVQQHSLGEQLAGLGRWEEQLRAYTRTADQLASRMEQLVALQAAWQTQEALRLEEIKHLLEGETFIPEVRLALAAVDAELITAGYDPAAHDAVRQAEAQGQAAEAELRQLERAQVQQDALDREIQGLEAQHLSLQSEAAAYQTEYAAVALACEQAEARAPDLNAVEQDLLLLQEQENQVRMEVGAARQKVVVLADLKNRRQTIQAEIDGHKRMVGRYKVLEMAFSKDGVPALLIEQALPQIEASANDILDRLSSGTMSVRFKTQAAYKDKKRDDLRETLDIEISDSSGTRDYEMFSGGEAFRLNFAIRLALSEVLAQRAGARLQTLVIDEGFGSQDTLGRQRLIEAINLVRDDFAKILVITHIDELKDAFPTRIEVEKTPTGSQLRVI